MQAFAQVDSDLNQTGISNKESGGDYLLAHRQFELFSRAYETHKQYEQLAEKCNNFYLGNQWDETDLREMQKNRRPALTVNKVFSIVNTVLGEQIGQQALFQFKPRRGGTEDGAYALSKLAMSVCDLNGFQDIEGQVFADGVIEERGWIDMRMDFSSNVLGEIRMESVAPTDVIPDPDARDYDPATWREVWRHRWYSLDEIEETYGQKVRDRLAVIAGGTTHFGVDSVRRADDRFRDRHDISQFYGFDGTNKDLTVYVRVITRQFLVNTRIYSLVDYTTGETRDLPPETTKKEAEQMAQAFGAGLVSAMKPRVRWRVTADRELLHDDWSIYKTFSLIPYFPYFRRGRPMGLVRHLLSPQEQLNKLESQELHIINTTANSGYYVEKGALYGMTEDDLRAQGAQTGLVVTLNPGKMAGIRKIEPNKVPPGVDRAAGKAEGHIHEISGVNEAMLGLEGGEVSGVTLNSRERRGQVQLQKPFSNLRLTRRLLARKFLELVRGFYTEERVVYYTQDIDPSQEEQQIVINQRMPDGSIVNNVMSGDYNVVVTSVPTRDNFNDTQFAELINLRSVGVNVPSYRVIQYSSLMHRDEIAEEIRSLEGLGPQSPEQAEASRRALEAELAQAEGEAQKKMAAARELLARADLNEAKAGEAAASEQRQRMSLEFEDVRDRRTAELRRELAVLNAINRLDVTDLAQRMKRDTTGGPNVG